MQSGSVSAGALLRQLRHERGLSQTQLAAALAAVSGQCTVTREEVSRWERDKRRPGPFWTAHLAAVLKIPPAVLEDEMRRRTLLCAAALAPLAGDDREAVAELAASVATGDPEPLRQEQTTHRTDLGIAALLRQDAGAVRRLTRWTVEGDSGVLRVNAAGVLAKTGCALDTVALSLRRDADVRSRYVRAVTARVGTSRQALAAELINPRDAGARWCSAWLLGRHRDESTRRVLIQALHGEGVRENVRTIALILQGADPCMS